MPAPWLSPIGARTRPCSSSLVSPGDSALHSSILGKNVSRKECALPHCSLQDGLPVSPSGLVLSRWRADSSPKMGVPCGLSVSGLTRSLPARTHRCAPKSSDKHLPIPAERTDLPGERSATCQARLPPIAATSPSVGNLTGPWKAPALHGASSTSCVGDIPVPPASDSLFSAPQFPPMAGAGALVSRSDLTITGPGVERSRSRVESSWSGGAQLAVGTGIGREVVLRAQAGQSMAMVFMSSLTTPQNTGHSLAKGVAC